MPHVARGRLPKDDPLKPYERYVFYHAHRFFKRWCGAVEFGDLLSAGWHGVICALRNSSNPGVVRRVIRNKMIDTYRKIYVRGERHRYAFRFVRLSRAFPAPFDLDAIIALKEILDTINAMSPQVRLYMQMQYLQGYTPKEIAVKLGKRIGTVDQGLYQAREALRAKYADSPR